MPAPTRHPPHPGITEPVPRPLQRLLRQAVLDLANAERRRTHESVLHVGVPGQASRRLPLSPGERLDHALCVDIVEAMLRPALERRAVPLLWLTRRVLPDLHAPEDQVWSTAVHAAGADLALRLDLVVVTRHGWHDPRSGVRRSWKRIRSR